MYDAMVMAPDCTMSAKSVDIDDRYNDCGDYPSACLFFMLFQVVAAFCVLNLVVAIILNAFTWCYSLEPSEITAGLVVHSAHLLHFKQIWDRFDANGTGFVDVNALQFLMAVVQYHIPELCGTGKVDQLGQKLYKDFASYGSTHDTAGSEMSRLNMLKLLEKLLQYERVLDVHMRLESQGVDLQKGDNTNIFNDKIDNGVLLATSAAEQAKLLKVRYSTLITVLLQDAVGLNEHDRYVCHGYRDPFDCRAPGYNETEIQAGRIVTCKVKPSVVVQRKSHRPSYEYETWV